MQHTSTVLTVVAVNLLEGYYLYYNNRPWTQPGRVLQSNIRFITNNLICYDYYLHRNNLLLFSLCLITLQSKDIGKF